MAPSARAGNADELERWFRLTRGAPSAAEARDVGHPARHPALDAVRADLRHLGVRVKLAFVWSGDGSGVEEEAPATIHIHRALTRAHLVPAAIVAEADRMIGLDIASVARHEIGHALLFARPAAARGRDFRRLFGDVNVAYRVGHPVDEVLRRVRRHGGLENPRYRRVVSLYAATHPHERFAEAVRVALALRGDEAALRDWADTRAMAPIVTDQLLWAADWLRAWSRS